MKQIYSATDKQMELGHPVHVAQEENKEFHDSSWDQRGFDGIIDGPCWIVMTGTGSPEFLAEYLILSEKEYSTLNKARVEFRRPQTERTSHAIEFLAWRCRRDNDPAYLRRLFEDRLRKAVIDGSPITF